LSGDLGLGNERGENNRSYIQERKTKKKIRDEKKEENIRLSITGGNRPVKRANRRKRRGGSKIHENIQSITIMRIGLMEKLERKARVQTSRICRPDQHSRK